MPWWPPVTFLKKLAPFLFKENRAELPQGNLGCLWGSSLWSVFWPCPISFSELLSCFTVLRQTE